MVKKSTVKKIKRLGRKRARKVDKVSRGILKVRPVKTI